MEKALQHERGRQRAGEALSELLPECGKPLGEDHRQQNGRRRKGVSQVIARRKHEGKYTLMGLIVKGRMFFFVREAVFWYNLDIEIQEETRCPKSR